MTIKATELLHFSDFDDFVELVRAMQRECESEVEFDELELRANMMHYLNDFSRENVNCWVVWDDLKMIGFAVGRISSFMFFSQQKLASFAVWYVKPEYRKLSRAAFELFHNFENWAKLQGAFRIEAGACRTDESEAKDMNKMFARRGFTSYGELFYRNL